MKKMPHEENVTKEARARINFRPLLFCAFGLVFGVFLYFRIRFGGLVPSDFCFALVFLALALFPISKKRLLSLALTVPVFLSAGILSAHLCTQNFLRGKEEGDYFIAGTVCSFTVRNGYTEVFLNDLSLDGAPVGGKLRTTLPSENVRAGDIVSFEGHVKRNGLPMSGDSYAEYLFYSDVRYAALGAEYNKVGNSSNLFLRLSGALYDRLEGMGGTEAQVAYAFLTGNSHCMDAGLLKEVRRGGIAHIFAVSGLHIGILFGVVYLLFGRLGRKAFFPAIAAAFLYTAFCAFTVSSVRALVMCAMLGGYRAVGRKYDFLQSVSLAALVVLLLNPADWLSAGFRLSFGACLGHALFAGSLARFLRRIPKFPRVVANYLAANLAVQLFTLPILIDAFGYFSVWGFVLNLVLIPLLPALFLGILLFALPALMIPPAAGFFLAVPKGLIALFLLVFSYGSFSFVLTGFSLGAGGVVWLVASLLLSERVRLGRLLRAGAFALLAALFAVAVLFENVVFSGGRIDVYTRDNGAAALIRTRHAAVLVIDGDIRAFDCEDFLAKRYAGTLDAVLVLAEDTLDGINCAAFLPAKAVYAKDFADTGLKNTPVYFSETVEVAGLSFRFETRERLTLTAEGLVIAFDFENPAIGYDFLVDSASGGLKFSFGNGIIKAL